MHMEKDMSLKTLLKLELYNKDGNLIKKVEQPANTWVSNMLTSLWFYLDAGLSIMTGKNTDGNSITISVDDRPSRDLTPDEGEDRYGILVGSSDTPYNIDQYNLQAKIPHGIGTNKLKYGKCESAVVVDSIYISRNFMNESGSNITVKEIGLAVGVNRLNIGDWVYYLLARDVITPITVPHLATLKVEYRIKVL